MRHPSGKKIISATSIAPGRRIAAHWFIFAILFPLSVAAAQSGTSNIPVDSLRLTLEDARRIAIEANPDLRAARVDTAVARGELRQASVLIRSNPTVDVLTGGPGTELGVGQEIEIAGQRGARRSAAVAGLERVRASVRDTTRLTLGEVDRTFYRLAAATQRNLLAEQGRLLNERLADATLKQLEAGKISRLEYNLAAVEAGRARARRLATERERGTFATELRLLLGLPPTRPLVPVIDSLPQGAHRRDITAPGRMEAVQIIPITGAVSLDADSLIALALSRRPDLAERRAAARQALGLASLARREALPNLSLRASSEVTEGSGGRIFRPGVGLSIPIFNLNRGEVAARRAEALKADLQAAALERSIRGEVIRAVSAHRSAATERALLESTVLEPARENRRLLEIAFREGKVGLPVLLLIRNQVVDAELEYWGAWLAEREALTDVYVATAQFVAAPGDKSLQVAQ